LQVKTKIRYQNKPVQRAGPKHKKHHDAYEDMEKQEPSLLVGMQNDTTTWKTLKIYNFII
jgi:hypothetical protein